MIRKQPVISQNIFRLQVVPGGRALASGGVRGRPERQARDAHYVGGARKFLGRPAGAMAQARVYLAIEIKAKQKREFRADAGEGERGAGGCAQAFPQPTT